MDAIESRVDEAGDRISGGMMDIASVRSIYSNNSLFIVTNEIDVKKIICQPNYTM